MDGILGGVGGDSSEEPPTSRVLVTSGAASPNIQRVPNQLRGVVENSGVCGG